MATSNPKPRILISRGVFPEVVQRLETYFDVEPNPADTVWTKAELIDRLRDKDGAFTTGSDRIDAEVLAACPKLKICANMAVGYNNFDVAAMNAAGVVGTNTPDVLTETTLTLGLRCSWPPPAVFRRASITCVLGVGSVGALTCLQAPIFMAPPCAFWVWGALARALPSAARTVLA